MYTHFRRDVVDTDDLYAKLASGNTLTGYDKHRTDIKGSVTDGRCVGASIERQITKSAT